MASTAFRGAARSARGARSDPATIGDSPEDAPATVTSQDRALVATITARYGHDLVVPPRGDVDLAETDPVDFGCVVDLAHRDVTAPGTSSATGCHSPDRTGAGRLAPSWPSVLRVTNAFGTADLIDTREGASS